MEKDIQSNTDRLVQLGLPPKVARAAAENIQFESKGRPYNPRDEITGAHGLAQWRGERWANLLSFAASNGLNPYDKDTQLQFLAMEAKTKEAFAVQKTNQMPDRRSAYLEWAGLFERGEDKEASLTQANQMLAASRKGGLMSFDDSGVGSGAFGDTNVTIGTITVTPPPGATTPEAYGKATGNGVADAMRLKKKNLLPNALK
jgi:hypothetical protein